MADTVVILTSGSSWTVPADWNPAANTIEGIGGGQNGGTTAGGNGADYAKVSNASLSGSIAVGIGQPGATGGDTTFGSILLAKGGGSASTNIGTTTYAGGTGNAAGGGGGAAGPSGAGGNAPGAAGGTGDNGTVPADTSGTEWDTAGSGGGGSAAAAGASVVQVLGLNGAGTKSVVFNAAKGWVAPTPGNLLIAMAVVSSSGATKPSGFTDLLTGGTSTRTVQVWYKVADGTETSVTIGAFGGWLLEVLTTAATPFDDGIQDAAIGFSIALGPLTPSAANRLAIGVAAWNTPASTTWSADSGWTLATEGAGASFSSALAYKSLDASLAPAQVSIGQNINTTAGGCFLLVRPTP